MKYVFASKKDDSRQVQMTMRTLKGVAFICSEAMKLVGMRSRTDDWFKGDGAGLRTAKQCTNLQGAIKKLLVEDPELRSVLLPSEKKALSELDKFLPVCGGFEVY